MPDSVDEVELGREFARFATTAAARAPLYAALATTIAEHPDLSGLLRHAPATQRLPVLLFACVHELVLEHRDAELAAWYPNLTSDHRSPTEVALAGAFQRFVATHAERIAFLLATRTTQTNEVGRCGFLVPPLGMLATEVGPLGLLDVGASAGLNLLVDRFAYRYRSAGGVERTVGTSALTIAVDTRGSVPVPERLPPIAARLGLDERPIDVTDDDAARWLEACVWPDQADRFHRLVAAIEIARREPPEVLASDAVASLAAGIDRVGAAAHPVVVNSWVLNYLTAPQRVAYLAELDRIGAGRDLSWVYAEAPALIPELPTAPDPAGDDRTVLSLVRWRHSERVVQHLATVHPHGFWIQWRPPFS